MKLLIADDDPLTARLLADLARTWGYEPIAVADGQAALHVLRSAGAPRLAILDWVMPELDGLSVCRAIRRAEDSPYSYVILLTGRGGRDPLLSGLEAGADEFLVKPVDVDELRVRLNAGRRIVLLQEQLLETQQRLRDQATHDALTGLWNRGAILEILDRELARDVREKRSVGVLLADLDHFKQINDTHGHLAGDAVLRQVAQDMQSVLRPYDMVGRYGGEEFLIVFPGCETRVAVTLAERLRRQVAGGLVECDRQLLSVTVSLGVATSGQLEMRAPDLLRIADAALYRAKRAGRNRCRVGRGPTAASEPAEHVPSPSAAGRHSLEDGASPPNMR